jgi:GT2 family glycosyltransferase
MKTISAMMVVEPKHYPKLDLQLQNLHAFDKIYIFFNDYDENSNVVLDVLNHPKLSFAKSFTKESLDLAYKTLLSMCETDYFTLLSPNHFTHGDIDKYIKIEAEKDYDLIYVDEGYIENESTPEMKVYYYRKPDFDKELLYCQNYISRGAFYKTSKAKELQAFNNGLDFNSDWDFSLAFTRNIDRTAIKHIPLSLIAIKDDHLSNSRVGFSNNDKDVSIFIQSLKGHILASNRDSEISLNKDGNFHILFKPLDNPKVIIIIPTKDKLELLKPCVDSILEKTTYDNYGILIIDNNSEEKETIEYLNAVNNKNNITVLKYTDEFDFAKMHNTAIRYISENTDYQYVVLLNNDTEVINPDWLTDMVGIASDPGVGAVGAKLIYADNTIQHAGVVVGVRGLANHLYHSLDKDDDGYWGGLNIHHNYSAVTGACLLVSVSHYTRVSGMWEMLPIAYNDVDLCLSLMKSNLRNVWSPNALLYHYESKSRGSELSDSDGKKLRRFARDHVYMRYKHGKLINNDPYYNENFDVNSTNFKLGKSSPFRHGYEQKEYLLDVPYGLEFVDPTWLPMPAGSKFNFAIRVPLKTKAKIKGLVLPYHQQELENIQKIAKFHATIKFPDDDTRYEIENISNNGKNVRFDFTGFERDISDIENIAISMYVVETTSSIHLKWFYSENNYSQAFEVLKGRQFRLIMILEDI